MNGNEKSFQLSDNLLFTKVFRAFRMAIQPGKLAVAFSALVIICLAGWLMDLSKTVVAQKGTQGVYAETELQIYVIDSGLIHPYIERNKDNGARRGVFSTLWQFSAARLNDILVALLEFNLRAIVNNIILFFKAAGWAIRYHPLYCLLFFIIKLAVISAAGGTLCRIAALQLAQDEKPGIIEALLFSIKRFKDLFAAPIIPVVIITIAGLFVSVIGAAGNIPRLGELIVAISMPLALTIGTAVAATLIGTIAGFNLMFPAVAYNGSDCFDAIGRSFSYVYAKPWRMFLYSILAGIYGAACYTFVRFFAFLLLFSTRWFLQLGLRAQNSSGINKLAAIWPQPSFTNLLTWPSLTANWTESVAAFLIYISALAVVGAVVSFVISFYFSVNTIIYALMRKSVDKTAIEDVYTSEDKTVSAPAGNPEMSLPTASK